jgi:hypothetical protein
MPTRILSWQQLVLENDPDWVRLSLNPRVWEFSNGRTFVDPASVYAPLPDSGLTLNGQFLVIDGVVTDIPTVDPHIPGHVFSNGGFVYAATGTKYQPGLSIFYPGCTLDQILLVGASAWPTSQPPAGSGQIFNNGGFACVA